MISFNKPDFKYARRLQTYLSRNGINGELLILDSISLDKFEYSVRSFSPTIFVYGSNLRLEDKAMQSMEEVKKMLYLIEEITRYSHQRLIIPFFPASVKASFIQDLMKDIIPFTSTIGMPIVFDAVRDAERIKFHFYNIKTDGKILRTKKEIDEFIESIKLNDVKEKVLDISYGIYEMDHPSDSIVFDYVIPTLSHAANTLSTIILTEKLPSFVELVI